MRYVACSLLALGIVWVAWQSWVTLHTQPDAAVLLPEQQADAGAGLDNDIAPLHLFGDELPTVPEVSADIDVTVAGIIFAPEPGASRVIVIVNGIQHNFAVDAMLPGGARLVAIEPNRAVLERNGLRQSLTFEHKQADRNAVFDVSPTLAATATVSAAGAGAQALRPISPDTVPGLRARREALAVPLDASARERAPGAARAGHRGRVVRKPG